VPAVAVRRRWSVDAANAIPRAGVAFFCVAMQLALRGRTAFGRCSYRWRQQPRGERAAHNTLRRASSPSRAAAARGGAVVEVPAVALLSLMRQLRTGASEPPLFVRPAFRLMAVLAALCPPAIGATGSLANHRAASPLSPPLRPPATDGRGASPQPARLP